MYTTIHKISHYDLLSSIINPPLKRTKDILILIISKINENYFNFVMYDVTFSKTHGISKARLVVHFLSK